MVVEGFITADVLLYMFVYNYVRGYILLLCILTILWIPVVKAATGGQLFNYIVVVEGFITADVLLCMFVYTSGVTSCCCVS